MIRRRDVLLGSTATVLAAGSLPNPAIAQGAKQFTLVTSYPRDLPGSGTGSPQRLARSIAALSEPA